MNTKMDLGTLGAGMVYVKPVSVADLPDEVRAQAGDLKTIFAVHDAEGEQLALVANRTLAFDLAREHDMRPVTLH